MIIVEFMGGMGNQMFQYAFGKSLSTHLDTKLKFDLNFLLDRSPKENFTHRDYDLDVFGIIVERATKEELAIYLTPSEYKLARLFKKFIGDKISPHKYFHEPHFHFAPEVYDLPKNSYLAGYWQSPKYFENVKNELRKEFTFKRDLLDESKEISAAIVRENSVCINVRRADFLNNSFHGVCDMKYFSPSIEIMASKVQKPHFFIFSDDLQWSEENFKLDNYPVTFVGEAHNGFKYSNKLHLMSLCKHFIIPNSSYAWWAVWLSNNAGKVVIAPKTWVTDPAWDSKDLVPAEWIRVEN